MSRYRAPALIALALLGISTLAPAQATAQDVRVELAAPTVTATGSAIVHVVPDQIELRFGVREFDRDLVAAKTRSDDVATKVIAFLREQGIAADDIQTAMVTSNAIYDDRYENGQPTRGELKGFEVYRGYGVTIRDVKKFAPLLDRLLTDTSVRVEGYTYKSSEDRKHRDQARREAARAAREKAELLATALDARVGGVRTIHEISVQPFMPVNRLANMAMDAGGAGGSEAATPIGQIEIRGEVTATFDLISGP